MAFVYFYLTYLKPKICRYLLYYDFPYIPHSEQNNKSEDHFQDNSSHVLFPEITFLSACKKLNLTCVEIYVRKNSLECSKNQHRPMSIVIIMYCKKQNILPTQKYLCVEVFKYACISCISNPGFNANMTSFLTHNIEGGP